MSLAIQIVPKKRNFERMQRDLKRIKTVGIKKFNEMGKFRSENTQVIFKKLHGRLSDNG
jgi:hypothetical protein